MFEHWEQRPHRRLAGRQSQAVQQMLHVLRSGEHPVLATEQAGDEIGGEAVERRPLLRRSRQVAGPGASGDHDDAPDRRGRLRLDRQPGPAHGFIVFVCAIARHRERELGGTDPQIARTQAEGQQGMRFGLFIETAVASA